MAIFLEPVDKLMLNFEYGKICKVDKDLAKAVCRGKVLDLGEKKVDLG